MSLHGRWNRNTPIILAQSAVPSSVTGTTAETALASITIPGGMIGPNGSVRIWPLWSIINNANTKTLKVKFGSVIYHQGAVTVSDMVTTPIIIRNRGALNTQIGFVIGSLSGVNATTGAKTTSNIDTSVDQVVTITGTLAVATDTMTLEGYIVEVLPG